ncbi:MAG: GtrA family protein [bacterium]|nr:GtrA family protein [bacterium]
MSVLPDQSFFSRARLIQFVKFGIVGGSGVFVNMGFLWLFTEVFGFYYIVSSVLAIFLAMINNFIWNNSWTWRGRGAPGTKAFLVRFIKFCLVASLAGYVGNLGVLWILTHFFDVYYLLSNLFGIAVATLLNYFLNDIWTFRPA